MRDDLKQASESYIRNWNKIENLRKFIETKGESLSIAKLQKASEILDVLGKQMLKDKAKTLEIIPTLSEEECVEWYAMMMPFFTDNEDGAE